MVSVSILVPAYKEEKLIENNISKLRKSISSITPDFEIIVVDDNSGDNTSAIINSMDDARIRCIHFSNGPSRRENLAEAMKQASNEIILFMDADLSTELKHLPKLIDEVENHADIAIGSRFMGKKPIRKLSRDIVSLLYNNFMRIYFGSKVKDHQCGFKAFKRKVIIDLIGDMGYDSGFVRGWFWDAELLIRAQRKRYRIAEFPVEWKNNRPSTVRVRREMRMILYILGLKHRLD